VARVFPQKLWKTLWKSNGLTTNRPDFPRAIATCTNLVRIAGKIITSSPDAVRGTRHRVHQLDRPVVNRVDDEGADLIARVREQDRITER
jgi:hypothetical protein